jgi:ATP-dependent helicase/nuclease subunit B
MFLSAEGSGCGPIFQCPQAYNRSMSGDNLLAPGIVQALERGATVVTGNQRAARTLRHRIDRRQRAAGLTRWQPAKVLSWEVWTAGQWSRLVMEGHARSMLLNRTQELAVWRAVLDADNELAGRQKDALAEMAADAWRLLASYNGQHRLRELAVSSDTRVFQRWAEAFVRRCRTDGLLARAGLEDALRQVVRGGDGEIATGELLLVGFDTLTPAQDGLIEAMRDTGAIVEQLPATESEGKKILVEAADEKEELRACARWVKQYVEQHTGAQVGIIVPGLETQRTEIDRIFREVLAPELEDIAATHAAAPYEFSVGVPLSSTPMVATALNLLRWATGPLPLERVSSLMLSPYFTGGREHLAARAGFDAFGLRRTKNLLRPELTLEALTALVERANVPGLGSSLAALRRMRVAVARHISKDAQTHTDWTDAIREILSAAAWGTSGSQDSVEFQMQAKWESALDELATLDFDGVWVRFADALESLEHIAKKTIFAAASHEAPVQVMGPLEAAGSRFDAVWFLRAGDIIWPMPVATSPLLPWNLQRDLKMPGSDAAREMDFGRRVVTRIAESAGAVSFSYARLTGEEGAVQRTSPALSPLVLEAVSAAEILRGDVVHERVAAVTEDDDVRLPALPDRVIRGGAALLAAQAACGFKAFSEQRLWSSELQVVELGMNAAERGTVVHGVLELFWNHVKTQEELKAMTSSERNDVLDWCIAQRLTPLANASATAWDLAYVDMERRRLHTLLGGWLDLEAERPPFEVKLSEKRFDDVRVGPLRLSVIVDRVDLVDDGGGEAGAAASEPGEMILDYKTGRAEPGDWQTDRPDAPQLPLYAVLSQAPRIAGVAFAKVQLGRQMDLHGYATKKGLLTKGTTLETMDVQIQEWQRVLTNLADEFAAGDARVRPKEYPKTCQYCAQRLVCRLDVAALDAEDDEEDEDENE